MIRYVDNTGHLGALLVTSFLGMTQGTKRVITVTGVPARQVGILPDWLVVSLGIS